jgi:hypothetical protein
VSDKPLVLKPDASQVQERHRQLALHFRRRMTETERPQFEKTNEFRTLFFKDVIARIKKVGSVDILSPCVYPISHLRFPTVSCPNSDSRFGLTLVAGNEIIEAGRKLKSFIDEHQVLFSESFKSASVRRPLIILAFDEAHGLTETPESRGWSLFSELRRCLSEVVGLPIFTLFLSTAGKFHLFSPPRLSDYSSRIVLGANWVLPPISETGFDQFALDAKEGEITLDRVVEIDWICRLGRPLYVFLACAL